MLIISLVKKGKNNNYNGKNPNTNDKTNHNDDLLIVLDVGNLTSYQDSDYFHPNDFFSQQHEKPVLVLDEKKLKQYGNDIDKAINDEITKQKLDTKKINNVKVIDIQHSDPYTSLVYVHNNDMCVNLVKAINKCFPDIKRTKLISTSCHSETIDERKKDLRVELYKAVNGGEWKQEHKLDLYLTPFNEINGKFKLNKKGDKIKQHIRLMNTKLAPSLGDDMTIEQKQYAQNMLQFMMNGQIYSYIKDTDGKAKISLHIREYEPDEIEKEDKYTTYVSLKRKKTEEDQGKKTLKNYCTLKEMSEFLQEYYQQCEKQINEYFDKYPSKEDAKMKNKLVDLKYLSLYREKIEKDDIIKTMGKKWYDDKLEECRQEKKQELARKTRRTIFDPELSEEDKQRIRDQINTEYNEDEYVKGQFISQKVEEYKQSLQNKSLSEQEKTQASKEIALDEGLDDINLKGRYVNDIECYLPRKIENVQIENDNNIVYNQSKKYINNLQNEEKNENDIIYESRKEKEKEMNNSRIETKSENICAGCNCNKCCNLF